MTGHVKYGNLSSSQLAKLARFREMAERQLVNLGAAIEDARKEQGLSRSKLARLIPVEAKTVERWEKGQTGGAMESLESIAKCLKTSTDDLLAAAVAKGAPPSKARDLMESLSGTQTEAELPKLVADALDALTASLGEKLDKIDGELKDLRQLQGSSGRTRKSTGS